MLETILFTQKISFHWEVLIAGQRYNVMYNSNQ